MRPLSSFAPQPAVGEPSAKAELAASRARVSKLLTELAALHGSAQLRILTERSVQESLGLSPSLPAAFAAPAVYGDLGAAILAVVATIALSRRASLATLLVWLFNVWGARRPPICVLPRTVRGPA